MTAADIFVKELENHDVEFVFGLPGDENLQFMEALNKSDKIRFILVRHEGAAGYMANLYGQITGKIAVAMTTLGAGAMNITTPIAQAFLGAQPALYLTGQKAIRNNMQGKYQLVNVVDVLKPISKFSKSIQTGAATASIVHEALHIALEERRGPVHIELPMDVAEDEGEYTTLPLNASEQAIPTGKSVQKAIDMLNDAKRPLILVGGNANRSDGCIALRKFINKTKIPFFVTMMGKGVVDERIEQYIGTAAMPNNDYIHCAIYNADLILNVGHDIMEKPPFMMKTGEGPKVIHLNDVSAISDPVYFPQHQVIGNMATALDLMSSKMVNNSNWDFSEAYKAKAAQLKSVESKSGDLSFPIKPQYLTKVVRDFMKEEDIMSVDNGIHKLWFSRNYPAFMPNTLIIDNALGSMGPGLPGAIAAKLAFPNKTVVAVTGDGGFMMHSQELETAMRLKLDLIIIILNDNGLGMIRLKQMAMGFQPNYGVNFTNPDFVKYAESFGANGHIIKDAKSLPIILNKCKADGGVHLIDVPIDYTENKMLFMEMKNIKCKDVLD